MAEKPADLDPTDHAPEEAPEGLSGKLVRRDAPAADLVARRPAQALAALWNRLPEIARHPAVVAAATVGAGLAVSAARQALTTAAGQAATSAALPRPQAPVLSVSVHVVNHVHVSHPVVQPVVHHVVHHVTRVPLPPGPGGAL